MIHPSILGEMLKMFLQVYNGSHYRDPLIIARQLKKMTVRTKGPGVINIDGELYKHEPEITIQCLPKSFQLFAPVESMKEKKGDDSE
jgi:diacylglycerol kinase family enzyme